MSEQFSNLNYLYDNLPARARRDDQDLFLKRFLSVIGEELDGFDLKYETFFQNIDPATASAEFIEFWLYALFGWGWFPSWFTLERRRAFFAAIASQHYPERGTLKGIKNFLAAFGLQVIVEGEPRFWGEETWGEKVWSCPGPLVIIVRLLPQAETVAEDLCFWGEGTWGEDFGASPSASVQLADVDALLRFVWPLSQHIFIENLPFHFTQSPGSAVLYGEGEYGEAIPG